MDNDTTFALIETLKLINANLEITNRKIEILERDFRDREAKRKLFKWLIAFYPLVIGVLICIIDADHHKIAEVAGDMSELINDSRSLIMFASNDEN